MKTSEQIIAMRAELKAKAYEKYKDHSYGFIGSKTTGGQNDNLLYDPKEGFLTGSRMHGYTNVDNLPFIESVQAYEYILGL